MKTYVIITGLIFGLLAAVHVLRMLMEDAALVRDPFYVAITVAAAALCGWSVYVLRRLRARPA